MSVSGKASLLLLLVELRIPSIVSVFLMHVGTAQFITVS